MNQEELEALKLESPEELVELLSELEHEQWMEWSKNIAKNEKISVQRLERWKTLWKPYLLLSEETKKQDRIYARKVIEIIKKRFDSVRMSAVIGYLELYLGKLSDKNE